MGAAAFESVASAKSLVGMMVAVVVSFVASTAASQYVDSTSAKQTNDIVGNAMPSIQALSLVRGDLRDIDRLISRRTGTPLDTASDIREDRRDIDALLASYVALPFFAGEHKLYAPVPDLLRRLDDQLAVVEARLDDDGALAACRDTIDSIDGVFQRLVAYDASEGQRLGLSIAQTRSRSRSLVWLLDAACGVLAALALALALRQRRQVIRVLEVNRAAAESELSELRTRVDELGHFAGRVAHDIRNPLQTVALSLDVIRGGGADSGKRAVDRAGKSLQRMTVLVDGLLEFARAGGKPAEGAIADVHAVIDELVVGLAADAKENQIELVADVPFARVACSTGVLTSIVANLARNAIRHMGDSAERRIEIIARDAGASWRIEIQDTGPGIPPGQEKRIFEPHVQLHAREGGIGLGLATVERLVHAHHGDVGVISPPGCGARFWVELPKAS